MLTSMMSEAARFLLSSIPTGTLMNVTLASLTGSFLVHRAMTRPVTSVVFWGSSYAAYGQLSGMGVSTMDLFYQHPAAIPLAVLALWTASSATVGLAQSCCAAAVWAAVGAVWALLRFFAVTLPFAVLSQAFKLTIGTVKLGCSILKLVFATLPYHIIKLAVALVKITFQATLYTIKTLCAVVACVFTMPLAALGFILTSTAAATKVVCITLPVLALRSAVAAGTGLATVIAKTAVALKNLAGPVVTNPVMVAAVSLPAIGVYAWTADFGAYTPSVAMTTGPDQVAPVADFPSSAITITTPEVKALPIMNEPTYSVPLLAIDVPYVVGCLIGWLVVGLVFFSLPALVRRAAASAAKAFPEGFFQFCLTLLRAGVQQLLALVGPPTDNDVANHEDPRYDSDEEEGDSDDEALQTTFTIAVPVARPRIQKAHSARAGGRTANLFISDKPRNQPTTRASEALPPQKRVVGSSTSRGAKAAALPRVAPFRAPAPQPPRLTREQVLATAKKCYQASASSAVAVTVRAPLSQGPAPQPPRLSRQQVLAMAKKSYEDQKKRDFDAMNRQAALAASAQPTKKKRRVA